MSGEQIQNRIVPWYAAKVRDLRPGNVIGCICGKCGHAAEITVEAIQAKLQPYVNVNELGQHLRCQRCKKRGGMDFNARAALGYV